MTVFHNHDSISIEDASKAHLEKVAKELRANGVKCHFRASGLNDWITVPGCRSLKKLVPVLQIALKHCPGARFSR
jgi:hypothetical protein